MKTKTFKNNNRKCVSQNLYLNHPIHRPRRDPERAWSFGFPGCLCLNFKLTRTKSEIIKGNEETKEREGGSVFDLLRCERQRLGTGSRACRRKSDSCGDGLSISSLLSPVSSVAKTKSPSFSIFFLLSSRFSSLPTLAYYFLGLLLRLRELIHD